MGCIARLGCLVVLAILLVAGWFTRDRWLPEQFRTHASVTPSSVKSGAGWQPITSAGAERTRVALDKLN